MQRSWKRGSRRSRSLRSKLGVSEVVGTILILALTVVLFSSIFFFVNTFPKPATQSASQFQGQLYYTVTSKGSHTWTNVTYATITHLAGPVVYSFNTYIYVVSQAHPQNTTTVYGLASGGLSSSWGTGQVWNVSLVADHLTTPDNITITVVAGGTVVYRQILPGTNPSIPPIFENEGTVPTLPVVNSKFSIFVQISDPFLATNSHKVYLNISTPGLTCSGSNATETRLPMAYNATNGLWFIGGCTTSTAASYYVSVWVTDSDPIQVQQNSIIFPVSVVSSSTGSGCSNTYTVTEAQSPSSATSIGSAGTGKIYLNFTNANACAWIYVSVTFTPSAGSVAPGNITNDIVPVSGTLNLVETYTAPTLAHGTATATVTISITCPTGATTSSSTSDTATFKY